MRWVDIEAVVIMPFEVRREAGVHAALLFPTEEDRMFMTILTDAAVLEDFRGLTRLNVG